MSLNLSLQKLTLKNFATFEDQIVNFDKKFNAIVGETGSGKSLILDALQLILGHRADKKLIRKNCEFSIIEASFSCENINIKKYFNDIGFPFDEDEVLIKRIIYKTGKTKSFLNHQICALSTLIDFSKNFIDLVGQFENQKLLSESYQLALLDDYSNEKKLQSNYNRCFEELVKTQKQLISLKSKNLEISQKLDYINFQINELESLSPSLEEEVSLLDKKKDFQLMERRQEIINEVNNIFDGDNHNSGLLASLNRLENLLSDSVVSSEQISQYHQAKEILQDLNYSLNQNNQECADEENLEVIMQKLDAYQKLKRKFNTDTEGLIQIHANFLTERDEIQNIDKSISLYEERVTKLQLQAYDLAKQLHQSRIIAAKNLSSELTKEVQFLKMNGATIDIKLTEREELTSSGITVINLLAETNPGEGYYKIKEIASGGELSRILLSIRKVLSSKDSISIFLFDEIDTGIGGETALTIGKTLQNVSRKSQVIAITHLPQIATYTDKLVLVEKKLIYSGKDERTISVVNEVSGTSIKDEVTAMTPLG